jgi:Bifunctional DNA primase/polymerase, N-terminal
LPPKIAEDLRRDYREDYNIGFRTGDWSKLDGWPVAVLDADIRSDDPAHRGAAREAWRELVGDMKPTVKTGGGGKHLYLRCPPNRLPSAQSIVLIQSPDKLGNKPAWTIELLSGGHAVTLPPSIHPSGKPYKWVNGGLAHVEAMPESLLEAVAASQNSRRSGASGVTDAWPDPKPIIAELKPVPAFDADTLLPDVLRAWIMDEAERMPCPPDPEPRRSRARSLGAGSENLSAALR